MDKREREKKMRVNLFLLKEEREITFENKQLYKTFNNGAIGSWYWYKLVASRYIILAITTGMLHHFSGLGCKIATKGCLPTQY